MRFTDIRAKAVGASKEKGNLLQYFIQTTFRISVKLPVVFNSVRYGSLHVCTMVSVACILQERERRSALTQPHYHTKSKSSCY
jgi:hypothetical protein